jgi:hypothetical protein
VAERESGSFTVVPIVAQRRIRLERQLELGRDVLGRERRHRPGKLRRNVLVLDPGTAQDPQLLVAGEPVHQRREKPFPRFGAAHADVGLCGRENHFLRGIRVGAASADELVPRGRHGRRESQVVPPPLGVRREPPPGFKGADGEQYTGQHLEHRGPSARW